VARLLTPNLDKLISNCWSNAEIALRNQVREKYRDRDEEQITDLFHAELEIVLGVASKERLVEKAFLRDLGKAFPHIRESWLSSRVSRRLVATVSFHARDVEKKTGGDVGIVLVRPDIQQIGYWLMVHRERKRGLLCQSKILRRDSKWGPLTKHQTKALRGKLSYLALLLYRYSDQDGERRELLPFSWQPAHKAKMQEINRWLAHNNFPDLQDSGQILRKLANGEIGTSDLKLIEKDVTPPQRPSLVIEVSWSDPDFPGPGGGICIPQSQTTERCDQRVILQLS
jgi:hypothetical protein